MDQTPKQQAIELLRAAKRVLVMGHQNPDGDAIGSVLAMTLVLRKLGKEVTPLCADPVPPTFQFLPSTSELTNSIKGSSDFVITLDTSAVAVDKLGYKNYPETKTLNIVIKTNQGQLTPEMVSFGGGAPSVDLILVLDTNDVERLGALYTAHTDLFYKTPIINIDHHPGNDYFGKVNWVDLAATSTAEILVSLIEALAAGSKGEQPQTLLDPDIATLLLAGITTDTGSFQNTNTTPKSFTVAAQLVAAGARQQEIVQYIYKTKPLSTLKLWGKILSSIQEDRESRFIWSSASAADFKNAGAAESETSGVVDELMKAIPNIDFALLLSEKKDALYGSLRGVNTELSVADVAGLFGGGGHEMASAFRIPGGSLADNESEVLTKIRDFQAKRLKPGVSSTPIISEPSPSAPAEIPSAESLGVVTQPPSSATTPTAAPTPQDLKQQQATL